MNEKPKEYSYFQNFMEHLNNNTDAIRKGIPHYPKEIEIQLPPSGKQACNLACSFCIGKGLKKEFKDYTPELLELIGNLQGKVKKHLYSGAFTEPLLNSRLLECIEKTKETGSFYGLKTNGTLIPALEKSKGFASRICALANSRQDFISISLDAGSRKSYAKVKGKDLFKQAIEGIQTLSEARGSKEFPTINVTYLLTRENSSIGEIKSIISRLKKTRIDYVRFSLPYSKEPERIENLEKIKGLMSKSREEKPYFFYVDSKFKDPEKIDFAQCIACYNRVIIGADSWLYKCAINASTDFKNLRAGKVNANIEQFEKALKKLQSKRFKPASKCKPANAKCDRVSAEINQAWHEMIRQWPACR